MPPASFASSTFTPDNLIVGEQVLADRKVTLLSGENRARGALLGKITVGAPSSAARAGNTGNGTLGTLSIGAAAKSGVYTAICIEPATNLGTFRVEDPDGNFVGTANVGVAFTLGPNFTIADGATDFVAGDGFDITVAAGTGKYKLSALAATDGSQVPDGVLAEACDASAGDAECLIYTRGDFNETAMTFGAGNTADVVREVLRDKGIFLSKAQGA